MVKENFVRMFEDSFRYNWELDAYTDYETKYTMTYAQVAEQVEKLHLLFQQCGIEKNDKVALIGRNCAHWAVAYVATITYGAVIVPILQDFRPDDVHHIVKHSDSKLLFTADYIWDHLDENELGQVRAVIYSNSLIRNIKAISILIVFVTITKTTKKLLQSTTPQALQAFQKV